MINLLSETLNDIQNSGHSVEDIEFIGSEDGEYGITWGQFETLANCDYDNGFGGQKVVSDLTILFKDGQTMWRGESDGSEWWSYSRPLNPSPSPEPITTLFPNLSWDTISGNEGRLKEDNNE